MTDHYSVDPDHRPMQLPSNKKDNEIRQLKQDIYVLTQENKILKEKLLELDPCIDIEMLLY